MKNIIFVIALILSINVFAQNEFGKSDGFVRVYDLNNKKIGKGWIMKISEKSLQLDSDGKLLEIPASIIGKIKSKHSAGNNLLVGTVVGVIPMTILGAATAEPDAELYSYTAGEGAAMGAVLGGVIGVTIGGISILFKNAQSYEVKGDPEKWKVFREMMAQ